MIMFPRLPIPKRILCPLLLLPVVAGLGMGDEEPEGEPSPAVKLPGIELNLEEGCLDIEAGVCLDEGSLELVACKKGTKEHESVVAVEAKAVHIHTALLLLGAKPGHPAGHRAVEGDEERLLPVPPSGGQVAVSLVCKDKEGKLVERPISDFIKRLPEDPGTEEKPVPFPTDRFLFAGSRLVEAGSGPRRYLADSSGNLISISTFGDETLCLPGVHGQVNAALIWEINPEHLPAVGTQVILRLRPVRADEPAPEDPEGTP